MDYFYSQMPTSISLSVKLKLTDQQVSDLNTAATSGVFFKNAFIF